MTQASPATLTYSQHAILEMLRIFKDKGIAKLDFETLLDTLQAGKQYDHTSGSFLQRAFAYLASGKYQHWVLIGSLMTELETLKKWGFLAEGRKITPIKVAHSNIVKLGYDPDRTFEITNAGARALELPTRSSGFPIPFFR